MVLVTLWAAHVQHLLKPLKKFLSGREHSGDSADRQRWWAPASSCQHNARRFRFQLPEQHTLCRAGRTELPLPTSEGCRAGPSRRHRPWSDTALPACAICQRQVTDMACLGSWSAANPQVMCWVPTPGPQVTLDFAACPEPSLICHCDGARLGPAELLVAGDGVPQGALASSCTT